MESYDGFEIIGNALNKGFKGGLVGLILGLSGGFIIGEVLNNNWEIINQSNQAAKYLFDIGCSIFTGLSMGTAGGLGTFVYNLQKHVLE